MSDEEDFEDQLQQEELSKKLEESKDLETGIRTRTDPDGTVYEWDPLKKAWFPKIDDDFIAQYQMNYGVDTHTEDSSSKKGDSSNKGDNSVENRQYTQKEWEDYYDYYYNYNSYYSGGKEGESGEEDKKGTDDKNSEQGTEGTKSQGEKSEEDGSKTESKGEEFSEKSVGAGEDREWTDEEKKQYYDYWSYYYGEDYYNHYYGNYNQPREGQGEEGQLAGQGQEVSSQGQEESKGEEDKKKKKGKRRQMNQPARPEGWFNVEESHNTNVYVSGLPLDVTDEEFKDMMSKCGLIMNDPFTRKPKIKLYRDEKGEPKGDGRCCYIKRESVELALQIIDGAELRGHKIHAAIATFQLKGDFDPSKKKRRLTNKEKRKLKERQAKLFDWRPDQPLGTRPKSDKTVVLKNLFDPKTFEENPVLINSIRDDVRTECNRFGEVKKIIVYDRHQDGVVTVMYQTPEEADLCVQSLNHRWFAKRRIMAATWDGVTKYEIKETEAEREARLKKWEKFIAGEEEQKKGGDDKEKEKEEIKTDTVSSVSDKRGEETMQVDVKTKETETTVEKTHSTVEHPQVMDDQVGAVAGNSVEEEDMVGAAEGTDDSNT